MTKDTTRERILDAACEVFAVNGFDKTTVRDICARADVNVAAINYHFRDKQNLFYKVLSRWMENFVETTEVRVKLTSTDDPEEKLRAYIHAELGFMCKINDPEGVQLNQARLILQELTSENHNPDVFQCHKEIEEELLFPVVVELIGTDEPEVVKHACIVATSMTTHYFLMALDDDKFSIETAEDLDFLADFLTAFAMGGLKGIREKYNA